jgi:hypothetical protein
MHACIPRFTIKLITLNRAYITCITVVCNIEKLVCVVQGVGRRLVGYIIRMSLMRLLLFEKHHYYYYSYTPTFFEVHVDRLGKHF